MHGNRKITNRHEKIIDNCEAMLSNLFIYCLVPGPTIISTAFTQMKLAPANFVSDLVLVTGKG